MARIWKFGSDVDTDQMVPGRYAPYMRPDKDVGEAAFIEARPDFNKQAQAGDIIVAGSNFGCGSSREYAPLALKRRGIAAIIAPSFARIFYRNAINLGIPVYVSDTVPEYVSEGAEAQIDQQKGVLSVAQDSYELAPLPAFAQAIVAAGGVAAYIRREGRLPQT